MSRLVCAGCGKLLKKIHNDKGDEFVGECEKHNEGDYDHNRFKRKSPEITRGDFDRVHKKRR